MGFFDELEDDLEVNSSEEVTDKITDMVFDNFINYPELPNTGLRCIPLSKLNEVIKLLKNKNIILYIRRDLTREEANNPLFVKKIQRIYRAAKIISYSMNSRNCIYILNRAEQKNILSRKYVNKKTLIFWRSNSRDDFDTVKITKDSMHCYTLYDPLIKQTEQIEDFYIKFDCIIDLDK